MALGLLLLYVGAEWLVRGGGGLALSLGVRPVVVGLTVVAYGTSAPELAVSALAAAEGNSAIALGNVIGSNLCNFGLVLGSVALLGTVPVDGTLIRFEVPVLLATALLFPLLLADGVIGRSEALGLLLGAATFTIVTVRRGKVEADELDVSGPVASRRRLVLLAVAGSLALPVGGELLVRGASAVALRLGVGQEVVGMSVVAIGTSLPELAASLVAALRGHAAIAVGNVIGSNIFNVLFVLGGAGLMHPITGSLASLRLEVALVVLLSLLAFAMFRKSRVMRRAEGAVLLLCYALFLGHLVLR